jgi:hypothetical protein
MEPYSPPRPKKDGDEEQRPDKKWLWKIKGDTCEVSLAEFLSKQIQMDNFKK